MKSTLREMSYYVRRALCVFAALAFFLAATRPASAQGWRTADALNAWNAFETAFYYTDSSGRAYYYQSQAHGTHEIIWNFAEDIEMAIDHYTWSLTYDSSNSATYKAQVLDLINGFRNIWGDCALPTSCNWANNDGYDDDLGVTELAFVRCYEITGSSVCLSDAENSFQAVYARGWDSTFGGGLWWNVDTKTNKSSSANWTAVIAGYLLYKATGTTLYKTDADNIYNWATSSSGLEVTSTGQVYNDQQSGAPNEGQVSYNYGLAAGAAYMEGDTANSNAIGTYLINNTFSGASGATENGYYLLPNYGQSINGFGAFNAMTFRWMAVANEASGGMPSNFVAWADANLNQGWAVRNPDAMTWDDWIPDPPAGTSPTTPTTGLLATDCTPMLVGMWWFAPTAQ